MTDIVNIVSYDSLRAVLGVDDEDIADSVIANFDLEPSIRVDMHSWFPNWQALIALNPRSESEQLQYDALTVYLKYFCAYEIIISANFQFLQRKSDGEVESHRFMEDSLETLKDEYQARMDKAKANLLAIDTDLLPVDSGIGRFTLLKRGSPNTDVITD